MSMELILSFLPCSARPLSARCRLLHHRRCDCLSGCCAPDIAIAGETMVQRLFDGFLLAVPFIVSANIMNAGTISDRLLHFLSPRRPV